MNVLILAQTEFIKGVDISNLLELEDNGGVYTENGIVKDPIQIFKDHNINFVRLKLWHTPENPYNNIQKILLAAQKIKSNGLKFLLDIHYSDTWADPDHQSKPAAWNDLSFQSLKDSIYSYTKAVISTLGSRNLLPDIVQIGNEITCGMLWDDGRICNQYDTQQQWENFTSLLKEATIGVNDGISSNDSVKIMIHIDRGGDNAGARWFFDNLIEQGVSFDLIGLSFYPWWHGSFTDLQNNLNDLSQRYGKEIIVVESAYPWTLDWCDNTNNIIGMESQLLPGYPATVQGQKSYLIDLMNLINNTFNHKGIGLFYWEPDWICTPTSGSPWENLTLFDFSGNLLPSINAFHTELTNVKEVKKFLKEFELIQNYPNPFNPSTIISWQSPVNGHQTLKVYDVLGIEVATLIDEFKTAGKYEVKFDASALTSGIYFYKLQAGSFVETKKMILMK